MSILSKVNFDPTGHDDSASRPSFRDTTMHADIIFITTLSDLILTTLADLVPTTLADLHSFRDVG